MTDTPRQIWPSGHSSNITNGRDNFCALHHIGTIELNDEIRFSLRSCFQTNRPWTEILKDDYTYADQVFIGTVTEVQKIVPSGNDGIAVDRIKFSVKEMIKGDVASVDYAETQNFDGFTSGCGLRLRVGERYLIMVRRQQLTRAVTENERWDTSDPEITVKTVRGFRDQPTVKQQEMPQK